jgi:hypothetical protein
VSRFENDEAYRTAASFTDRSVSPLGEEVAVRPEKGMPMNSKPLTLNLSSEDTAIA